MNTHLPRITFAALALVTAAATAADFYVAPNGNDADPGSRNRPFATPARAMAAVRTLVSSGLKTDVRVVLRGGIYSLGAPLVFTSADSGTKDHAITYVAEPGETVVISGGREITNWTVAGGSKWTAELAGVKSGQWFFRQLVVNDQRAVRARWPNEEGVLHLATVDNEVKSFTFDRALPQESLGGQDAELVVYENWSVSRALVSSSDQRQLTTATAVGWIGHGDMTTASPGKPAFIEHAPFALDQPHEWFLDRRTGTLTYLAAPGEKPAQTVAVAPVLTQLVKIAGTKDKPVRNVRFERLRFEHTDFALPSVGYSEIQAAHFGSSMKLPTQVQPVAIECAYAENIRFERCRMAHLNNSGIGFGPGCRRNAVVGCLIEDIGGNGVMVGWRGNSRLENRPDGMLDSDWMEPTDAPSGNEVSNCVVRRCGADSRGAVGIFVAFSADTRVAHNVIHDLPYTGVSIGYRWDTTPTSQVRCVAEYNHIYDVMKTLADGGGFYTLGFQPGTVLRGNLIHDVHRSAYAQGGAPNNGFFIDEGSKGFLFESNVVHNTSGESVRFNQCQREWHTWTGNAFDSEATTDRIATAAERAGLQASPQPLSEPPDGIAEAFDPPQKYRADLGGFRSPLLFADGTPVRTSADWQRRRAEILATWHRAMGPWPPLIEKPRVEVVNTTRRDNITQQQVRIEIALGNELVDALLLVPDPATPGRKRPAVLVTYYDAETGVGLGAPMRDYGWQLAKRGFVTLSIGKPNAQIDLTTTNKPRTDPYLGPIGKPVRIQPLSALAYAAANAHTVLAQRTDVHPDRIGIVGHSFGGKWAMFASCLHDKFAAAVWSDPGIVFDERDRRQQNPSGSVNYWDVWYLGFDLGAIADPPNAGPFRKLPSEGQPRTGAYKALVEDGHDLIELHALMAPRPFLVSGGTADLPERWTALNHAIAVNKLLGFDHRVALTAREGHTPTAEANEQVYRFFEWCLRPPN